MDIWHHLAVGTRSLVTLLDLQIPRVLRILRNFPLKSQFFEVHVELGGTQYINARYLKALPKTGNE